MSRKREPALLVRPAMRPRMRMLVWVLLSFSLVGGAAVATAKAGARVELPRAQTFAGDLRPAQVAVPVLLPTGFALDEIVVAEGDLVQPGQTLAVFDKVLLAEQLLEIEAMQAAAEVTRGCLGSDQDPTATTTPVAATDLEAQIAIALQECRQLRQEQRLEIEMISAEIEALEEQSRLLQHKIRLIPLPEDPADFEALQDLVATSLAGAKMDERILERRGALKGAHLRHQSVITMQLQEVADRLKTLRVEQRSIERALAAPRIVAMSGGQIGRVRRLPSGFSAEQPIEIATILPDGRDGFEVIFAFPLQQRAEIVVGTQVQIQVLGLPGGSPVLAGQVASVLPPTEEMAPGLLRAEVALSDQSQTLLNSVRDRLAFGTGATASVLSVHLSPETLSVSASRVMTSSFAGGDGFFARLLRDLAPSLLTHQG